MAKLRLPNKWDKSLFVWIAEDKPTGPDWATILAPVTIVINVNHKKFGDGKITWIDKHKKYLRVAFIINGQNVEKQFIFSDAFINSFFTIKQIKQRKNHTLERLHTLEYGFFLKMLIEKTPNYTHLMQVLFSVSNLKF